jgi:hypothetical protein
MSSATILDRLIRAQHDGAWGYGPHAACAAEPTCWAAVALHAHGVATQGVRSALHWLESAQRPDGAVAVMEGMEGPAWVTGPAIVAWRFAADEPDEYDDNVRKAVDWLLASRGKLLPYNPTVFGHDTSLTGWSWVEGTHSWVEPTAYAIIALRAAGYGTHPRVREGVRLLLDRSIPGGGWNYGNTRVYQNTLRPFPGPTGIVLAALAGEPHHPCIQSGVEYLERELPAMRSPMSLAWGLIGLTAWERRPDDAEKWLAQTLTRAERDAANPLLDSLLLMAAEPRCPLLHPLRTEVSHG